MKNGFKFKSVFLVVVLCVCMIVGTALGLETHFALAETSNRITATTNENVSQGSTGYCYIYADSLKDISSLDVSVHFDSEKVSISNVYNTVSCTLYDYAKKQSSVQFSYIFDGNGADSKTQLFYFSYRVLSTASIGESYFDIVVGDCYDSSLNVVAVEGSRCTFNVSQKVVSKQCSVYSNSTITTSVQGEFSLTYRLSVYDIASGSFSVTYDADLFEVINVANGRFLNNKIVDVNTDLNGSVYVSFVGTEKVYYTDLITITFKTKKNVEESSSINVTVTDLYDFDLDLVSCNGCTTAVKVAFDETYTADSPSMVVSAVYSANEDQVVATIKLAAQSHLGAGDFVLSFDASVLTFASYSKGFSPSFFNVNDKEVDEGKVKFSIISLSDITTEEVVITVVFDVTHFCENKETTIGLSGSGLADSLTNSILLNFVDGSAVVPLKHVEKVLQAVESTCEDVGLTAGLACSKCNAVLQAQQEVAAKGHNYGEWIAEVPAMCETAGTKGHYNCSVCKKNFDSNKKELTDLTINALGHNSDGSIAHKDAKCTETGVVGGTYCTRCNDGKTAAEAVIPALGHSNSSAVEENRVESTCTELGHYDSVIYCSRCTAEVSRTEKPIDALGHDEQDHSAQAPTCTAIGWNAYVTCSRCSYTTYSELKALGHNSDGSIAHKDAKCTETGVVGGIYCTRCNDGKTAAEAVIPALGHKFSTEEIIVEVPATCTEAGTKAHWHCNSCDNDYDTDQKTIINDLTIAINPNAHKFGTWIEEVPATMESIGTVGHKDCEHCNKHFNASGTEIAEDDYTIAKIKGYNLIFTIDGTQVAKHYLAQGSAVTYPESGFKQGFTFAWSQTIQTMPASDITIEGVFSIDVNYFKSKVDALQNATTVEDIYGTIVEANTALLLYKDVDTQPISADITRFERLVAQYKQTAQNATNDVTNAVKVVFSMFGALAQMAIVAIATVIAKRRLF